MKLQHKTTLYLLIPAIILMGVCAYLQFEIVNEGIIGRVDKQLLKEKKLLLKQLQDIANPDEYQIYKTLKSEIEFIEGEAFKTQPDQFYSRLLQYKKSN